MNFDFGEILSRAWKIVWKFKILWVFGFLYSCGRTGAGSSGGGGRSGGGGGSSSGGVFGSGGRLQSWLNSPGIGQQELFIIVGVIVLIILVSLFILALSVMGKIGLVRGTINAESGAEQMSFGELWQTRYFGRLFGLHLLIGLAGLGLLLVFLIPLILGVLPLMAGGRAENAIIFLVVLLCLLPLVCIVVPVMLVLGIWLELAQNALIIEDLGVIASLRRGWQVFRASLVNSLIMGFILWLAAAIAGTIVSLPVIFVVLPGLFGFIAGSAAQMDGLMYSGVGLALLCLCIYLPFALVGNSIVQAYQGIAWALTYLRLTGSAAPKTLAPVPAGGSAEPIPPSSEESLPPAI